MEEFFQLDISSEEEMTVVAQRMASLAKARDVITLNGNLGAGKTVFCRGFIRHFLGSEQNVISPTFNLVQMYVAPDFYVWHFDLYRLKNETDLYELGIDDAFSVGVSLIEWPDLAKNFITNDYLTEVDIKITGPTTRNLTIKGRIGKLL